MNIQINSPYKKCPFRCPYCVAGVEDKEYHFTDDFYNNNPGQYIKNLEKTIIRYNITTAVITGSTEPTLFPYWIKEVINVCKKMDIPVELQTKNYNFDGYEGIDIIAYSHDKIPTFTRTKYPYGLIRDVFVYNQNLTAEEIVKYFQSQENVDQLTIKQMVLNSYGTKKIDEYIKNNKKEITNKDQDFFLKAGAYVDMACDVSEHRYIIYRTDGNVYQRWSDMTPLK